MSDFDNRKPLFVFFFLSWYKSRVPVLVGRYQEWMEGKGKERGEDEWKLLEGKISTL